MEKYSANFFTGDKQWSNDFIRFHQKLEGEVKFLEVGSFEGLSANWICDHMLNSGKLYCVDPWDPWHPDLRGIEVFLENTSRNSHKIEARKGSSKHWLKIFGLDGFLFDFIFIDGNHNRDMVLHDAVNSFDLLRLNHYMVFDDYNWEGGEGPQNRPKEAIDCFLKCYAPFLEVEIKEFHVIVRKIKEAL